MITIYKLASPYLSEIDLLSMSVHFFNLLLRVFVCDDISPYQFLDDYLIMIHEGHGERSDIQISSNHKMLSKKSNHPHGPGQTDHAIGLKFCMYARLD